MAAVALILGDDLDRRVDGVDTVIARVVAAAIVNDLLGFRRHALPGAIARPEVGRRREGFDGERRLGRAAATASSSGRRYGIFGPFGLPAIHAEPVQRN